MNRPKTRKHKGRQRKQKSVVEEKVSRKKERKKEKGTEFEIRLKRKALLVTHRRIDVT